MTADDVLTAYKNGRRGFPYAILDGLNLEGSNLAAASFYCASLRNVNLSRAVLTNIQLKGANMTGASLENALVDESDLIGTNFSGANLRNADFTEAALYGANCRRADLRGAHFGSASLGQINLDGAKLAGATLAGTHLDDTDLRPFCSAKSLKHSSPSSIDARAIMRSYTHPGVKQFLIDCGVPELFAEYMIDCARALGEPLLRSLMQSTFISYGAPDEKFAKRLYDSLKAHRVVAYFFPETARVGERIGDEVFRQIQAHDRLLLVCSKDSLDRPGVINEIHETLDREARAGGATYLLPIMIDEYVLTDWRIVQPVLAERVGRRIVADFRKTRTKAAFSKALDRVIDSLKIKRPRP